MYLECKNFAKTKKNAFEGGDQMYLKCKKFAKTKNFDLAVQVVHEALKTAHSSQDLKRKSQLTEITPLQYEQSKATSYKRREASAISNGVKICQHAKPNLGVGCLQKSYFGQLDCRGMRSQKNEGVPSTPKKATQ